MAYRIKCPECNGCMNAVWAEATRYWHCWFCKTYYAGRNDELVLVDDPFQTINTPVEVKDADNNNAPAV